MPRSPPSDGIRSRIEYAVHSSLTPVMAHIYSRMNAMEGQLVDVSRQLDLIASVLNMMAGVHVCANSTTREDANVSHPRPSNN